MSTNKVMKYAYTHGLFCAKGTRSRCNAEIAHYDGSEYFSDGCQAMEILPGQKFLDLYYNKQVLVRSTENIFVNSNHKGFWVALPSDMNEKYYVPLDCSVDCKVDWLTGLLDGDGYVTLYEKGEGCSIQVEFIDKEFLDNVIKLLKSLEVMHEVIYVQDIPGEMKLYTLFINDTGVVHLKEMGYKPKLLIIISDIETENQRKIKIK
jgi:hypothetical protein